MSELTGMRILVVEDEYLIADDICQMLDQAGATPLGPAPNVDAALAILKTEARVDGALLDVNLQGQMAYRIADLLDERAVPYAFATGYERDVLPQRFADRAVLDKPVGRQDIARVLGREPPPLRPHTGSFFNRR
jgi:CheY-like chemotaxis protein